MTKDTYVDDVKHIVNYKVGTVVSFKVIKVEDYYQTFLETKVVDKKENK